MLLGFQRQFAPYVEEGSKTHTIRGERKIAPRPGETCHCYVDPRQKTMRLLGRFPCVRVQEIVLRRRPASRWGEYCLKKDGMLLSAEIDGVELSISETEVFFFRDGFRSPFPGIPPHAHTQVREGEALQELMSLFPSTAQAALFWKDRTFPFRGPLIHWEFSE